MPSPLPSLSLSQVWDLSEGGPQPGLTAFKDIKGHSILGCGGDGTIGWIFSELDKMQYPEGQLPPVRHYCYSSFSCHSKHLYICLSDISITIQWRYTVYYRYSPPP